MDQGEMDGLQDLVWALPPGKVRTMLCDVDSHEILTLLDVLPAVLRRRVLSELSDTEIRRVREAALESCEVRRTLFGVARRGPTVSEFAARPATFGPETPVSKWRDVLNPKNVPSEAKYIYALDADGQPVGRIALIELALGVSRLEALDGVLHDQSHVSDAHKLFRRGGWDELPLVNSAGKFTGVLYRDRIVRFALRCHLDPFRRRRSIARFMTRFAVRWTLPLLIATAMWHFLRMLTNR
jgi:CBS domain-containing protein